MGDFVTSLKLPFVASCDGSRAAIQTNSSAGGQYLPVVLQNWGAESRHSQIEVKLGLGDL